EYRYRFGGDLRGRRRYQLCHQRPADREKPARIEPARSAAPLRPRLHLRVANFQNRERRAGPSAGRLAGKRHQYVRRRQSGNRGAGYDLNGDGIAGDRPWLTNLSVFGKSFDNARVNPSTGRQYSTDAIPTSAFFPTA